MRALAHILGLDGNSYWYNLWSGFFGDVSIFGAIVFSLYKHNCHQSGCWRLGKHTVEGSPYCSKHKDNL